MLYSGSGDRSVAIENKRESSIVTDFILSDDEYEESSPFGSNTTYIGNVLFLYQLYNDL